LGKGKLGGEKLLGRAFTGGKGLPGCQESTDQRKKEGPGDRERACPIKATRVG